MSLTEILILHVLHVPISIDTGINDERLKKIMSNEAFVWTRDVTRLYR